MIKRPPSDQLLVNTRSSTDRVPSRPPQVIAPNNSDHPVGSILRVIGLARWSLPRRCAPGCRRFGEPAAARATWTRITLIQVYPLRAAMRQRPRTCSISSPPDRRLGAITPTERDILRGQERTVAWSVDPGYRVQSVMMNGSPETTCRRGQLYLLRYPAGSLVFCGGHLRSNPLATDEEFVR